LEAGGITEAKTSPVDMGIRAAAFIELCIFRAKSAGDSGMKSATDSDLISAIPI
jgi:hypothetical protein